MLVARRPQEFPAKVHGKRRFWAEVDAVADNRDVSRYAKPLKPLELPDDSSSQVVEKYVRRSGGAFRWGSLRLRPRHAIGVLTVVVTYFYLQSSKWIEELRVPMLAKDEIVILRTPGGKLQVSTLVKNEEFSWQTTYTCPIANCGSLFGKTVSKVRVPVHYTYAIPLAAEWSLTRKKTYFELTVPKELAIVPPGIDMQKFEVETTKGWLSPSGAKNQVSMLKHLGPELESRARRSDYVAAQREEARKTVSEFARKWMVEQGAGKDKKDLPVKVIFEGEGHADTPSAQ